MTNYSMTTKDSTRIRPQPNTGAAHIGGVPAGVVLTGSELFTATAQLSNADGTYQLVGDQWLRTTYAGVTGWVARIHMGKEVCINFTADGEVPPPAPVVLNTNYIVIVNEELRRVVVKSADGKPLAGWSASVE